MLQKACFKPIRDRLGLSLISSALALAITFSASDMANAGERRPGIRIAPTAGENDRDNSTPASRGGEFQLPRMQDITENPGERPDRPHPAVSLKAEERLAEDKSRMAREALKVTTESPVFYKLGNKENPEITVIYFGSHACQHAHQGLYDVIFPLAEANPHIQWMIHNPGQRDFYPAMAAVAMGFGKEYYDLTKDWQTVTQLNNSKNDTPLRSLAGQIKKRNSGFDINAFIALTKSEKMRQTLLEGSQAWRWNASREAIFPTFLVGDGTEWKMFRQGVSDITTVKDVITEMMWRVKQAREKEAKGNQLQ